MKGYESQLIELMAGADKRFAIPVYQRKYDWKTENCKQLYDDLIRVVKYDRKNHFFGSIVSEMNPDGVKNERIVIDGQQRLTTVTLLLLAIYNILSKNILTTENKYLKDKLLEEYLVDKYETGDDRIKLIPVKEDREALKRLFNDEEFIEDSNLTINYKYFRDRLMREEASIDEIVDAIGKLQIINLTLNTDDNAQLIFESLNSTGKDLDEADKIRNYVLMDKTPAQQEKLYNDYWSKIEKNTRDNLDMFFRDYLSVKTQSLTQISKIYGAFKEYVENRNIETNDLLSDINSYSGYYNSLLKGNTNSKKINGCIKRLNVLETSVVRPFFMEVLSLYDKKVLEQETAEEIFECTENYLFRRVMCELPTNALNKIYLSMNKDVMRLDGTTNHYADKYKYVLMNKRDTGRFPDDEEFIDCLQNRDVYHMQSKNKAYIMERFENGGSLEDKDIFRHLDDSTYSIEHIMPQHLTPQWVEALGENYEEIHETWLHKMANLTLTAYNSKYSNESFDCKKTMENGYLQSGLRMNQRIAQNDKWDVEELEERNNYLATEALKIWEFPSTEYEPPVKEMDTVSLGDETDLIGRQIAKYTYLGNEQPVDSWIDMYERIIRQFYSEDKSIIIRLALDDECGFVSSDETKLRDPMQLDEKVYVEKHGNNNTKANRLIKLFNLFNKNEYDLVFFLKDEEITKNISMDNKRRFELRRAYWSYALPIIQESNKENGSYSNVNITKYNGLAGWFGISGCYVYATAKFSDAAVSIMMRTKSQEKNKAYFDNLYRQKECIEKQLGTELVWERRDNEKYSKVYLSLKDVSIANEEDWKAMAKFHAEWTKKLIDVCVPVLKETF